MRPIRAFCAILLVLSSHAMATTLGYVSSRIGSAHDLILRRDGETLVLADRTTRTVLASARAATTDRVTIRGADGEDDSLTIDLTQPIMLLHGIDYDGGADGWDTLNVTGGSARQERITQLTQHDGIVDIDGLVARYTNLEPLIDTASASSLTIVGTAGADTVTISDGPGSGQATISSPTFESITFATRPT